MHVADHVEDYAKKLRGNWMKFECFVWSGERDVPDPENWTIVYVSGRNSGLLTESNAAAISKALTPFLEDEQEDISEQSHSHWAVGYLDGYAIRVHPLNEEGIPIVNEYTPAFQKWCELELALENYPVLNEDDYCQRETEATIRNIMEIGCDMVKEGVSEFWANDVYSKLPDCEIENIDDQGGWPSEEAVAQALRTLGMLDEEYDELED